MAKRNRFSVVDPESVESPTITPSALPDGFVEVPTGMPLAQPGDKVVGKYIGPGKPQPMPRGKPAPTFQIETESGVVANVLGSAQIESFLATVKKGTTVYIERLGTVKGGKGRVNTYRFAIAK